MTLPVITENMSEDELDAVVEKATSASAFLKAISHEGRLMILCHLVSGEKSVTELEDLISARQAAVSQQLSRLRLEGLVVPRRDGKTIYYRLADDKPMICFVLRTMLNTVVFICKHNINYKCGSAIRCA